MFGIYLDFPFYYIVICIFFGIGYASFLYRREKGIAFTQLTFGLFFCRSIFTSILALLLLNPILKSKVNSVEKPIVIIAKDNSKSVKQNINEELQYLKANLDNFEVFSYSFSDKVVDGFSKNNNGLKTDYSELFLDLNNKFENRNLAGVIIATDGCYNMGLNPEYLSYDYPVYSIALGDTAVYKDIRIDNIIKNDIVFLGNTFPLEISLASSLNKNENSKLKIWNNGVKVYEESIVFLRDIDYDTYTVYLPANEIGLQNYTIEVDPLDNEKNSINNSFETYIDIIDSRYNILILKDLNSPDVSAYKSAIEKNQHYTIDIRDVSDDIILEKYQLVVIFGVKNIPVSILTSDVPLIVFNSHNLHYIDLNSAFRFNEKGGIEEVSVCRNTNFTKFFFSSDLLNLISEAPPLFVSFGTYNLAGSIESVLNQHIGMIESNNPLIMIQELDSRRVSFILATGWWRWKFFDYSVNNNNNAFDELFLKLTQYLILKEDKSLFRLEYEKQYEENSEVVFRAALYNESYELVNNKEVNLKLVDEKGREYNFQFSKLNKQLIVEINDLDPGAYNFIASVEDSDLIKKGIFDVKKIQLEQLGLSANHQVLENIALLSDGQVFYLNNIQNLIDVIKNSKYNQKTIHYKEKLEGVINISWVLLILLILISIEWLVRKYNGLI